MTGHKDFLRVWSLVLLGGAVAIIASEATSPNVAALFVFLFGGVIAGLVVRP